MNRVSPYTGVLRHISGDEPSCRRYRIVATGTFAVKVQWLTYSPTYSPDATTS